MLLALVVCPVPLELPANAVRSALVVQAALQDPLANEVRPEDEVYPELMDHQVLKVSSSEYII